MEASRKGEGKQEGLRCVRRAVWVRCALEGTLLLFFAGSKGITSGSLLKACLQNSVLIYLFLWGPVVMMSDVGWFPGHKPWAGNRSAFGGAFVSGNSTRVTELQAGANGD